MKKLVPILAIILAVTAFWFRDRWLPQTPGQSTYLGYVEGETVLIGAPQAGRLMDVAVNKGEQVKAGEVLFQIDDGVAAAQVSQAEAAVTTAEKSMGDLLTGKRPDELASIQAQITEAQASLDLAEKDLARTTDLAGTGTAAQQRLDQAKSQAAVYRAQIAQYQALLDAAKLPARPDAIAAAQSRIQEAKAALEGSRHALGLLAPKAPADAEVDDRFFDPGEWVQAGQPVISLLPPGAITLRFFVPEDKLAAAQPGVNIRFNCDGCGGPYAAVITHVADQPEFTPPVIYSQSTRAKLVFRAEAKPEPAATLRPGLPIDVEPLP